MRDSPLCPVLVAYVKAGHLGRRVGRGVSTCSDPAGGIGPVPASLGHALPPERLHQLPLRGIVPGEARTCRRPADPPSRGQLWLA